MSRCLIGYTGFVGSNLRKQFEFDGFYNSSNINDIKGKRFELVVCAGAPAAKWIANQNPEKDLDNINLLIDNLRYVTAGRFVLISTVDVYMDPRGVDEDTPIAIEGLHPYGKHRFYLERAVRDVFKKVSIIRLPGLFGNGLKKNAIYDFINNNCLEMIHCDSVFQFYDLSRLYSDMEIVLKNELPLVNFSVQPIRIREIALDVFGICFDNRTVSPPAFYDMRSKYSRFFSSGLWEYMLSKVEIIERIKRFVELERTG